jgi:flagellar biosynthetic protein FliQ
MTVAMPMETVVSLARSTVQMALITAAPVLAVAIVVSLVVNIVQVLTSLQETTVATVPRLIATAIAAAALLPWTLKKLALFATQLMSDFHPYLR